MGVSQLAAMAILLSVGIAAYGRSFAPALVAVYWLSPWRLYHAGFLWEPGFLLLPAALHLGCSWLLRPPADPPAEWHVARREAGRLAASFGLGATLLMTLQIHASFLVLVLATAILAWRRLPRPRLAGFAAGAVTGAITLVPTALAFTSGELPRISPQIDDRMALPLMMASNAAKAAAYWFRMGSADIGRRLRQTVWLDGAPAGTEAPAVPTALVSVVVVLSIASVLIAVVATWCYVRRPDLAGDSWLRSYTLTMLAALTIAGAISPVPVQGWHVLIALHAACIPTAWWLRPSDRARRRSPNTGECSRRVVDRDVAAGRLGAPDLPPPR